MPGEPATPALFELAMQLKNAGEPVKAFETFLDVLSLDNNHQIAKIELQQLHIELILRKKIFFEEKTIIAFLIQTCKDLPTTALNIATTSLYFYHQRIGFPHQLALQQHFTLPDPSPPHNDQFTVRSLGRVLLSLCASEE